MAVDALLLAWMKRKHLSDYTISPQEKCHSATSFPPAACKSVWPCVARLDVKNKISESCIQAFTSCSPFLRSFLNDSNSEKCPDSLFFLERNSLLSFRNLAPGQWRHFFLSLAYDKISSEYAVFEQFTSLQLQIAHSWSFSVIKTSFISLLWEKN